MRAKEHEARRQNAKRGQNGGKIDERGCRERVFRKSFPIAPAAFFYVMGDPAQQIVEEQDVYRDKIERGERELPCAGKPVDVEHERNDARKRDGDQEYVVKMARAVVFLRDLHDLEDSGSHRALSSNG